MTYLFTHCGLMMHDMNLNSYNGMFSTWHQAIIYTNANLHQLHP